MIQCYDNLVIYYDGFVIYYDDLVIYFDDFVIILMYNLNAIVSRFG